jgi:hypothetical protein
MRYDPSLFPEGTLETELVIGYWDEGEETWLPLIGSTEDNVNHSISAPISHFSKYALLSFLRKDNTSEIGEETLMPFGANSGQEVAAVSAIAKIEDSPNEKTLEPNSTPKESQDVSVDENPSQIVQLPDVNETPVESNVGIIENHVNLQIVEAAPNFVMTPSPLSSSTEIDSPVNVPAETPNLSTITAGIVTQELVSTSPQKEKATIPATILVILVLVVFIGVTTGVAISVIKHKPGYPFEMK